MTANSRANSFSTLFSSVSIWARSAFRVIGRVALGGLAIVAAGIVALAMAVLGLLIALAALILRFTRGDAPLRNYSRRRDDPKGQEEGVILEARQTGQGWTVK